MRPINVTLSIAAGVLGGIAAPYLLPTTPVHAQAQIQSPKIWEAGAFRLVNEAGHVGGTLTINASGSGIITLFDSAGKVIFTSEEKPIIKPGVGN
jgi:hypothetical protein